MKRLNDCVVFCYSFDMFHFIFFVDFMRHKRIYDLFFSIRTFFNSTFSIPSIEFQRARKLEMLNFCVYRQESQAVNHLNEISTFNKC